MRLTWIVACALLLPPHATGQQIEPGHSKEFVVRTLKGVAGTDTTVPAIEAIAGVVSTRKPAHFAKNFTVLVTPSASLDEDAVLKALPGLQVWSIAPRGETGIRGDLLRSVQQLNAETRLSDVDRNFLLENDPRTQRRLILAKLLQQILDAHRPGSPISAYPFSGNNHILGALPVIEAHLDLTRARGFEISEPSVPPDPTGLTTPILDALAEIERLGITATADYTAAARSSRLRHALNSYPYQQVIERQLEATFAFYRKTALEIVRECDWTTAALDLVKVSDRVRKQHESRRGCALALVQLLR